MTATVIVIVTTPSHCRGRACPGPAHSSPRTVKPGNESDAAVMLTIKDVLFWYNLFCLFARM